MALNIRKFLTGLGLIPSDTSNADTAGELEVLSSNNKLHYHDGTSLSPVVTEDHAASLENKTIDADLNTITNIEDENIKIGAGINAEKIADGSVSNDEFQYLDGVTSSIQDQLDTKATITDLNNHINNLTDAHDASAISNIPAGSIIAVDVQAAINELDGDIQAHIIDSIDAHDASSISNIPSGNLIATDVQAALNELQTDVDTRALSSDLSNHITDAIDAHDASAISNIPSGNLVATDVQAALNELQTDVDTRALNSDLSNHITDTVDAHDASAISNVPSGNLIATDVQAALNELQTDVDSRATSSALSTHTGASTGVHGITGSVVGTSDTQTLTNKTVVDNTFFIQDETDNTKKAQFQASSISPSTTRTYTFPDANTVLVGTDVSQTLTNKTLTNPTIDTITFDDQASTPSVPPSGYYKTYFKNDGKFYKLDSLGIESEVSASSEATSKKITQSLHGFVVGEILRHNGTIYVKAQADTGSNSEVYGMVSEIIDANNFKITTEGYVSGLSGLTAGTAYYLSASIAGAITATEPSSIGQISKPVFISDSITSGYVIQSRGIAIADNSSVTVLSWDDQLTTPSNPSSGFYKTYFKTDGIFYKLNSSGIETPIGIGSSSINLISVDTAANLWALTKNNNSNAESTVGDWVAYADAAGIAPVDMTGGSPNTTITRTTSAINGSGSFLITINSGASRQGEGVSCLVNVPTAYRGQMLSLVFPFNTTGTLVEDDFKIYAYDVTNSTLITPTSFSKILGANGQVSAQFAVATNTAQLRVGIHIARTSTGAATITFDDVSLSNVIVPFGLSGSNPISYTPTFTGFGTVTTQSFRYSWVGNRVIIEGSFTSGTPTATVAEISLPTNLAIDSSLGTNVPVGTYAVNIAASGQFNVLASSNGTTLKIGYSATVGAGGNTPANGSAISSNGALITFFAVVLINNRSANLSIGESSTFSIAPYLANGTRVTTTPTKLGEYRSKYKTASSQDFSAWTDTAPATAPSSANGIRIYADAYSASGTATEPNAYEIFVGKNKNISQVPVWKSANKTTSLTRGYYSTGVLAYGLKINYNQETGVLFVSAGTHNGSNTSAYVGDAIDGSDQPTDGYFDVIISENALAVSSQQPRSEIYLEGPNGHGSTNTTIRRFTSSIKNIGSAITYSDSATLGSSFTINESGVYSISYVDARDVATAYFGLSLNSSQLTTSILSITAANRLIVNRSPADALQTVSICTVLNAGDVIRPHTDGTPTGVTLISFRITKVSS